MAGLSAAGAINTQLEQVQDSIPVPGREREHPGQVHPGQRTRYPRLAESSSASSWKPRSRARCLKVDLDSSTVGFPAGGASEWMQGTVSPMAFAYRSSGRSWRNWPAAGDVAVVNTVAKQLGRATDRLKQARPVPPDGWNRQTGDRNRGRQREPPDHAEQRSVSARD
jgi:hypothetical protein